MVRLLFSMMEGTYALYTVNPCVSCDYLSDMNYCMILGVNHPSSYTHIKKILKFSDLHVYFCITAKPTWILVIMRGRDVHHRLSLDALLYIISDDSDNYFDIDF